jgi:hypothetical protein
VFQDKRVKVPLMGNDKLGNATPATSVLCLPIIIHFGPGKSPAAISSYSRTLRTADMKVQAYTIVVKEIGCFSGFVRLFRHSYSKTYVSELSERTKN